ncbi:hypothetical protein SMALA_0758 [Streptomyces malaysiensis subsp. malaysiensis]|nr:hypothetical protein SMALA_0758 [Streptomyces malaysiensis]
MGPSASAVWGTGLSSMARGSPVAIRLPSFTFRRKEA